MADEWTKEEGPAKTDKYEWHLPNNEEQHMEETVGPGDLMIKPKDMTLVPLNSPSQNTYQSGHDAWTFTSVPDTSWYVIGASVP